jgi:hypothetical protein
VVLTEDDVVDAVCQWLRADGYEIKQQLLATQRGFDIVARKAGVELVIEAKGAGSSKTHTPRFGQEFNSGQVFDHVAKAVLKALRVVSNADARAGIALPDNAMHRRHVEEAAPALSRAGVVVFWVTEDGKVRLE